MTLGLVFAQWADDGDARLGRLAGPRFGRAVSGSPDSAAGVGSGGEAKSARDVFDGTLIVDNRMKVADADPLELARAGTWRKALTHYAPWGGLDRDVADTKKHFAAALREAENPVARQNVIFLAVRALPLAAAREILSPLLTAGSEGDVEDVVCALAFAGDEQMAKRFLVLAERPSPALVAQLRDTLAEIEFLASAANEDARDILRSYRAYEVIAKANYFRLAAAGLAASFPFREYPSCEFERRLLAAWLARYPGHPGSDDVALRVGETHIGSDHVAAARWFDRAAVLPDQHRTSKALRRLLTQVERKMSRGELRRLLKEDVHNRPLLTYVWVRRTAAEESCEAACEALPVIAAADPNGEIADAWLDRGVAADSWPGVAARLGAVYDRIAGDRSRTERLYPPRTAMRLSGSALARQFGLWERLAEMGRRADGPTGLFEIAKLTLAEPEIFFPVYARHTFEAGRMLVIANQWSSNRWGNWIRASVHAARAYEAFARIEKQHPDFARMDEVLLGEAAALATLLDFTPVHGWRGPWPSDLRNVLAACERCQAHYPGSEAALRAQALARDCRARYASIESE